MKTAYAFITAAAVMVSLATAAPAMAEAKYGVVDMTKVMQTADAAKGIFAELETKRKEFQAQVSKEEDALRKAEQEILKSKDGMSKEEFDKKRREWEQKAAAAEKSLKDKKRPLDQGFSEGMSRLRGEAAKIVAKIAKDKGYTAVFTQDAVILSTPEMDMTDAVIAEMNKSVKKIPLDFKK